MTVAFLGTASPGRDELIRALGGGRAPPARGLRFHEDSFESIRQDRVPEALVRSRDGPTRTIHIRGTRPVLHEKIAQRLDGRNHARGDRITVPGMTNRGRQYIARSHRPPVAQQ